jgi:outer membrane receptor protein involved in Fe transport
MKQFISLVILLSITVIAPGQSKKSGKVKRKYRDVEQIAQNLPEVFLRGFVYDEDKKPIAGATVTVDGAVKSVNTNEDGEFLIENLMSGKGRIRVSFVGYATLTTDYELGTGENFKNIMLVRKNIYLEPITVSAQKREQQILDVPAAISSLSATHLERLNITELTPLSELVPGLYIREQGANRPSFVIRGLSSEEVSASAQPRVSVYSNNVPINRASGASVELFDMERVEVLRGPQNTLFGRGAQTGAVHFISKMPVNKLEGAVTAGYGNYNQREIRAVVNVPVIEDKLFVRAAGIYNARDGYVENTFGGTLNGKNTIAGRFSARFIPAWNHKFDVVVNYQKDETPGIAFMSKQYPNTNGEVGIFSGTASHEQSRNLYTGKDLFDATLNYKYYFTEHTYWSSITSYRTGNSGARWDGDGTASAAIDMSETSGAEQFYQEIRGNFAQNSRLLGSLGASYWREKASQNYWFSPNEQQFASLMLIQPPMPVSPDGQPVIIPALPDDPQLGQLAGMPLSTNHQEENRSAATNQSAEAFMDVTYQLTRKLFVNAGLCAVYDMYKLNNEAEFTGGDPSTLGYLTGNAPNLFFKPSENQEISKNTFSFTGKAGLQYKFNEYGNLFVNYSRGRRPNVLQFTSTGEEEILDAEILDNFDGGFKGSILEKVYIDVVGFYQKYKNFQSSAWVADPATGEFNYKTIDGGKATTYGLETSVNIAIIKQLEVFGNYAWLHTAFDSTNTDGLPQQYAGNRFSLAPEHSFTAGINAQVNLTKNLQLFVSPSYSFKTHIWFTDANTEGIDQEAYGLMNVTGGFSMAEPNLALMVYGNNLLDEQYVTSGGNTGSMFGIPTFVPGPPRMFGAKITWAF